MKLSDTVKRIYKKIISLSHIEVLSDTGWQEVTSLNITQPQDMIKVKCKNAELICTKDHILIDQDGNEVFAKDSLGRKLKTKDGMQEVLSIESAGKNCAYDLSLADDTSHLYYADKMLSHNCVILDEFAFLQKNLADKLFTSMYPTISSSKNGRFIIVSTPNGTDNLYYDIWQQANSKDKSKNLDEWKSFEMYWWQVPGHDEDWKKKQIAAIGAQRFAQEFNNEFLTSTQTRKLIPDDVIEKHMMKLSEFKAAGVEPKNMKIVSEDCKELFEFQMWHEFDPKRTYLASADISEGIGGDSSVLYIWDVTDLANIRMCAKFSSNTISVVQFAYVARKMLALYNDPWLAAERNGVSVGMLDALRITYKYNNIAVENKKNEAGIYSHVSVKGKACLWAREMMTTDGFGFTIYDKDLVDEFKLFVKKDTKGVHNVYQALPGADSHDDHIMAFIWGLYLLNNELVDKYFIVCSLFNSVLGMQYPKLLQPLNAYSTESIDRIGKDQMYLDFLDFKKELSAKLKKAMKTEETDDATDMFKYKTYDEYFGDDDNDSWNSTPMNWNMRGPQQASQQPIYFNKSSRGPTFFVI